MLQFRLHGALHVYAQAGAFADEVERVCHVAWQCRLKNKGGCFREIKHFKGATAGGRCKNKAWVLFFVIGFTFWSKSVRDDEQDQVNKPAEAKNAEGEQV